MPHVLNAASSCGHGLQYVGGAYRPLFPRPGFFEAGSVHDMCNL